MGEDLRVEKASGEDARIEKASNPEERRYREVVGLPAFVCRTIERQTYMRQVGASDKGGNASGDQDEEIVTGSDPQYGNPYANRRNFSESLFFRHF